MSLHDDDTIVTITLSIHYHTSEARETASDKAEQEFSVNAGK
jgi:hypothetical protein